CPRPEPAVMAAALEAGVTRMFRIGGAHAIAALAYGTARVPRVDKIVGPGNRFVAAAQAIVARDCAIDFYAGPTEIVVVARAGRGRLRDGIESRAAHLRIGPLPRRPERRRLRPRDVRAARVTCGVEDARADDCADRARRRSDRSRGVD